MFCCRRVVLFAVFACFVTSGHLADTASAQVPDQRRTNRRAFVEDLLRGLIESQVPGQPNNPPFDNRQRQIPGGQRVERPVIEVSPEMRTVRSNLTQLAGQYDILLRELQVMEARSPYFRPLMADALQVRASVDSLARKAELYPRVDQLVPDYRAIDRDYRVLAHRLNNSAQLGQLSNRCNAALQQIASIDTQLCGLFGIQPQIDRQELLRLTTSLRSDFQHMLQDLYYESNRRPELRPVIQDGKVLLANINQATGLISTAPYPTIVTAYKSCNQQWKDFNRNLYRFADQRVLRDVQQIETLGGQIKDQLYLPSELDREYLAFLAGAVNNGSLQVLDSVSLADLLKYDQPAHVIENARELCVSAEAFQKNIVAGQSVDDLSWDYRLFDVQWATMYDQLTQLKNENVNQKLNDINFTVSTLRRTFGDGPAVSVDEMNQLATTLDQLTYQLDREVEQRTAAGYNNGFKNSLRRQTHRLHESVHEMQTDLSVGKRTPDISKQVKKVVRAWDSLKPQLAKLKDSDRARVAYYGSQIEPLAVKLKLVFIN